MTWEGKSVKEICDTLKVYPSAVSKLVNSDKAKLWQTEQLTKAVRGTLSHAVKKLKEQLDDKNPWVSQNAARTLIQLGLQLDQQTDTTVVVSFGSMPKPALPATGEIDAEGDVR